MRILFLGDVMGRSGRQAVCERVSRMRRELELDFVVVNAENASRGRGLLPDHARKLLSAGVDCLTLGDHAFDQPDMLGFIDGERRMVRPLNFARAAPGVGSRIFELAGGKRVMVVQALGQTFMHRPFGDPFAAVNRVLDVHPLGGDVQAILVDFHCEATSEKMAMGHHCDGRASLVAGTHTHVPTADWTILDGGTAYISDAGMCGDYNSVIGMEKEEPIRRFTTGMSGRRFVPSRGPATLSGVLVDIDSSTGLARSVEPIRSGGILPQAYPGG